MPNLQAEVHEKPIALPISTRGCGFIIRSLVNRFRSLEVLNSERCYELANALYRVTLLQIDYKLMMSQSQRNVFNVAVENFIDVNDNITQQLRCMGAGFALLVNYISAIGVVEIAENIYVPRHPMLEGNSCSPFFIRSDNLRSIAELLSSNSITNEDKLNFKNLCPIPGAKWDVRSESCDTARADNATTCNLVNLEDIIPSGYGIGDLIKDKNIISDAVKIVGPKYQNYVSAVGINYERQGSPSQIVSTKGARISCPSWPISDDNFAPSLIGDHDQFWVPDKISEHQAFMGVVYLFGEEEKVAVQEIMSRRNEYAGSHSIFQSYCTTMSTQVTNYK